MADKDVITSAPDAAEDTAPGGLKRHLDRLEQQFSLLNKQVQSLQRLASLGTMSAAVAHELNNLLTPIISYSQYALEQENPQVWRKAAERAFSGATRMQSVCAGILGMATGAALDAANTTLRNIIDGAIQSLGRDLSRDRIELIVNAPDGLQSTVEPNALGQVLFNLILNARQAMAGRGGTLSISACETPNGRVRLRVADTGMGINAENLPQVFEPFFTTRRGEQTGGGVGLGLHISRRIIESHGGTIEVASRPGEGATFTIDVPAAGGAAEPG